MKKTTTTKRSTRKITKPQSTPPPASPSSERAVSPDTLTSQQAMRLIRDAGYEVKSISSDMFRVHVPDPADGYHVRSYFDATRLREIAALDREGLAGAISSAPMRSRSPYFKEPNMSDVTTNKSKSTKGTGLPEGSISDAKVEEYIRKAAAAGVKQTPSAICRFIRAAGDGLSEKRCGRILGNMKDKVVEAEATETAKPQAQVAGNGKGASKKAATKSPATKSTGKKKAGPLLKPKDQKAAAAARK